MAENVKVLYTEKAPVSGPLKLFMAGMVALMVALYYYLGTQTKDGAALTGSLATLALVLAAFYWFLRMRFVVTEEALEVRAPLYRYRIPVADITSMELLDRIPWYVGWGIRLWGDTLYFSTQHKQSALAHKKSGYFRKVAFSAREPFKLMAGIQAAQKIALDKQKQAAV